MTRETEFDEAAARFQASVIEELRAADALYDLLSEVELLHPEPMRLGDVRDHDEADPDLFGRIAEAVDVLDLYPADELPDVSVDDLTEALDTWRHEYGYGMEVRKLVRITLAGGGPAGWIDVVYDSDMNICSAEVAYCDWFKEPSRRSFDADLVENVLRLSDYI